MIRDTIKLTNRELTPEGFLKAKAAVTSVGIFDYYGNELFGTADLETDPSQLYRVYRDENVVFDKNTLESLKLKPITYQHPDEMVTSGNCRDMIVGMVGEKSYRLDEKRLGANIVVTDKDAINEVQNRVDQVSLGYDCEVIKEEGTL